MLNKHFVMFFDHAWARVYDITIVVYMQLIYGVFGYDFDEF